MSTNLLGPARRAGIGQVILLVVSTVVASAAGYGFWIYATNYQELMPIVVAARDLPAFSTIRPSDLTKRMVPLGSVDPNTVQAESGLVGMQLLSPVYQGEAIRQERLATEEGLQQTPAGVSVAQRPGELLIGLHVDVVAVVGGALLPGDVVDVYVVPQGQEAQLAAVAVRLVELRTQAATTYDPRGSTGSPTVAVVRVEEAQVRSLLSAAAKGKLTLAKKVSG